jgi:hypothetical protein
MWLIIFASGDGRARLTTIAGKISRTTIFRYSKEADETNPFLCPRTAFQLWLQKHTSSEFDFSLHAARRLAYSPL